jgi:hypothetical protein
VTTDVRYGIAYVLIRDDFNTLHVASSLKDLSQDILRHPWIQTANIECPLVGFWSRTAHVSPSARWRHHIARHRGGDGGWNRVGVLRDDDGSKRWWRHVGRVSLAVALGRIELLSWSTSGRLGRRWEGRGGGWWSVFGHCGEVDLGLKEGYEKKDHKYPATKSVKLY